MKYCSDCDILFKIEKCPLCGKGKNYLKCLEGKGQDDSNGKQIGSSCGGVHLLNADEFECVC